MAIMAPAVRDINATFPRDTLAGVAARSVPVTRSHPLPLPTPPNSISPALPPHGLKAQLQKANNHLEPVDSDLDLHENERQLSELGSSPYDSAGNISSALLAKYHLPEILLNHGPLAIRHVMGYLTTSVPGFAGIPPAKARRLVVGALEGRGSEGGLGGVEGDVEFEKVGWGRWDARRRGQPSRQDHQAIHRLSPEDVSPPYLMGIPINKGFAWSNDRTRLVAGRTSFDEPVAFSHDDRDTMMMENEADKMSMDGSASASCSEAPDDDMVMNDDPEDVTDDEDWAAVGAAALRAASYSQSAQAGPDLLSGRAISYNAGMARPPQLGFSPIGRASDPQEREAIEALLRLGSV